MVKQTETGGARGAGTASSGTLRIMGLTVRPTCPSGSQKEKTLNNSVSNGSSGVGTRVTHSILPPDKHVSMVHQQRKSI